MSWRCSSRATPGGCSSATRHHDIPRAALNLRFFADYAALAGNESYSKAGRLSYVLYPAAGVVVAISPWNAPLMLSTWKLAPALAFGNTVVLKPAEQTPTTATRLAQLALQAGLPDGVLNVVHGFGPGEVGEALTTDPRVDRITFTGASETGKHIMAAAAAQPDPGVDGARRQVGERRVRGRRPGPRARRVAAGRLLQQRRHVPGRLAPARAALDPARVHRALRRGRRGRCASATRATRPSRSGR